MVQAVVFDAYGTLLDVHAAMQRHAARLGPAWQAISADWRARQLEYSWVRSLSGQYRDFAHLTEAALMAAAARHGVTDGALLADLLAAYRALDPFPDAAAALQRLNADGIRCAILSNGEPAMLEQAVRHAGLDRYLDPVLSVDAVRAFKPDPRVYRIACKHFGAEPAALGFVSGNAWDAFGAACCGFRVFWLNRTGQPVEYGLDTLATILPSLAALPEALLDPMAAALADNKPA
jgi:2-haloacid dehalogenase